MIQTVQFKSKRARLMRGMSPHYVHAVTRGASKKGFSKLELLEKAGIGLEELKDETVGLTSQQVATLFRAVWQATEDEFFGLGKRPCPLGFMRLQVLNHTQGTDLENALSYSTEFYRVARDDMRIAYEKNDQKTKLTIAIDCEDTDPDYFLGEYNLIAWQRYICWLIGAKLNPETTLFNYSKPSHAHLYADFFQGDFLFDQPEMGIVFDSKYLNYPIKKSSRDRAQFLKSLPLPIFQQPKIDKPFTSKVQGIWEQERANKLSDLEGVAQKLALPSRTLRRKLREEETSFQRIKNKYRCDLAIDCLTNKGMNVNEASQFLGFSEPAAFCHFFKKSAGLSPSKYLQFNVYV